MTHTQAEGAREVDWIRQAQLGDRLAYAELIRIHHQGVIGMVVRMCGDYQLAEDVAQDTFIRAWQNLPKYEPRSSLRNWLYRIAANRALDILRRERESVDIDQLAISDHRHNPEGEVEKSERQHAVQQAVMSLPTASRIVLVLREYEGLSYKEISETLEIPVGTVMSRLNYARNKLTEILHETLEGT